MDYLEGENLEVFESHKAKVIEWWEYDVLFKALIFRINSDYFFEKWSLSKVLKKEYEIWWFI